MDAPSNWYLNKDPRRGGWVYLVTDVREPDRVRYVGKTQVSLQERQTGHWYDARRVPKRTNSRMVNWLLKRNDTPELVVFTPEGFYPDLDTLNEAEKCAIERYRSLGMADLNITAGGEGQSGTTASAGTRRKMSEARRGEKHANAVLTWESVREIRARRAKAYVDRRILASEYGVSASTIEGVVAGSSWKDPDYDPSDNPAAPVNRKGDRGSKAVLTWDRVHEIRNLRRERWVSQHELALRYGLKHAAIGYVLSNTTWVDPNYDPATLAKRKQ